MNRLPSLHRFVGAGAVLAVAALFPVPAMAVPMDAATYYHVEGIDLSASPVAPQFASPGDIDAFLKISARASASPVPDPRKLSRDFIRENLGIDGDDYVVAHFATPADRTRGVPDRAVALTDALMEAFPEHSRHSFFAGLSDTVGALSSGGGQSPGIVSLVDRLAHSGDAKDFFARLGRFLWSRTGPGYLYNTFFARGNVVETVAEDARSLDEAFGVYRAGGFAEAYASPIRLSLLVERFGAPGAFAELPYVRKLNDELDRYWAENRAGWPVLARYEFVQQARHARDTGLLDDAQYRLVMRGGAAKVPLTGPIALAQLRSSPPGERVRARRLDINGYAATDLVRFVADDGREVMYVPGGHPSFVAKDSERELRQWVRQQAENPDSLDRLLAHFSLYDGQDGIFWTGVKHGLEHLGGGRWPADAGAIDHANALIAGDVFEDMGVQMETRMRRDARIRASTAWEAWRATINRSVALLGPLGYVPPLAIPVQAVAGLASAATGIDQGINGRTAEERKAGLEQTLTTAITSVPVGAVFGGLKAEGAEGAAATKEGTRPAFVPWQRVNGRPGYPLGPTRPPGWPHDLVNRLYRRRDGAPALWIAAEADRHLVPLPRDAVPRADGILIHHQARYVPLILRGYGLRAVRVVADAETGGYRILLRDGTAGPHVERQGNDTWLLGSGERDYLPGSILAQIVGRDLTADPHTLHRAAHVLAQLGVAEATMALPHLSGHEAGAMEPLLVLALGHGFIETLPTRLRDTRATVWSAREVGLVAPIVARHLGRPLALYRRDGGFHFGVLPDGTEFAADRVPSDTLRLQRRDGRYTVLDGRGPSDEHASVFAAVAEHMRPQGSQDAPTPALREAAFRRQLADAIDTASTRQALRRMHRHWMTPSLRSTREGQVLRRISRLRHALVDRHEALTADQRQWLRDVEEPGEDAASAGAPGFASLLAKIVDKESALLPAALDRLLVKDAVVLQRAGGRRVDRWSEEGRHYVRLRHLDGRMQVVETGPDRPGGMAEILVPGSDENRTTGYYVTELDGMWFPDANLRDGFAPLDPREYAKAMMLLASHMPAGVEADAGSLGRIAGSVPQPLLPFVRRSLTSVRTAADGGLELVLEPPAAGRPMIFATRVDGRGRPVARPSTAPRQVDVPAAQAADRQLVLPVPDGLAAVRHGPAPDPATQLRLQEGESPISAFVAAGFGNRHIKALANARRLRGMLREDTHLVLLGATPDHVLILAMPVDAGTLGFATSGGAEGRRVADLPAGTVIVDDMYGVRATAADYPARVREVARRWQAAGVTMKRLLPNGTEARESPIDFTERVLSTAFRPHLWSPRNDPISERAYVGYMHRRHASGEPARHAGLDWLQTRHARRDYMTYFAPPYDGTPSPDDVPASVLHGLAETAIHLGTRHAEASAGVAEFLFPSLQPDAPKEPRMSAGG
ncbi:dermonecrotic toxin domain-containing protein [Luteibacter yeojuensis]|uniref:Dermonecrotic toxin N-terminal domain-containing protein n=1 Tax=Luteibacter yeojuensis TaxID=345309 RepID=A0A7X5TQ96_9GAMM|nr:DUF6543 domain-containing protein [Luteibacter yeojuensis]NID15588.1 hypothetical protein [Luteibacter yeojuensis]